jgi:hypothetical protein
MTRWLRTIALLLPLTFAIGCGPGANTTAPEGEANEAENDEYNDEQDAGMDSQDKSDAEAGNNDY